IHTIVACTQLSHTGRLFSSSVSPPPQFYTLSLHDALPISGIWRGGRDQSRSGLLAARQNPSGTETAGPCAWRPLSQFGIPPSRRSEEHTSELQSLRHLVCRLLLEKKKTTTRPRALHAHSTN